MLSPLSGNLRSSAEFWTFHFCLFPPLDASPKIRFALSEVKACSRLRLDLGTTLPCSNCSRGWTLNWISSSTFMDIISPPLIIILGLIPLFSGHRRIKQPLNPCMQVQKLQNLSISFFTVKNLPTEYGQVSSLPRVPPGKRFAQVTGYPCTQRVIFSEKHPFAA